MEKKKPLKQTTLYKTLKNITPIKNSCLLFPYFYVIKNYEFLLGESTAVDNFISRCYLEFYAHNNHTQIEEDARVIITELLSKETGTNINYNNFINTLNFLISSSINPQVLSVLIKKEILNKIIKNIKLLNKFTADIIKGEKTTNMQSPPSAAFLYGVIKRNPSAGTFVYKYELNTNTITQNFLQLLEPINTQLCVLTNILKNFSTSTQASFLVDKFSNKDVI